MKRAFLSLLALLAILAVSCCAGRAWADEVYAHQYGTPASTQSPWDYRLLPTHGLKECGFSLPTDADAGVNGGVLSGTAPNLRVATQEGHPVRLVLICRRAYFTDEQGHLIVGPEVNYFGPGQVEIIGQEWPSDPTVRGHHPRGRMWTVPAGPAGTETTYTLRGGGDVLNVTIVPFRAPATVKDVAYYVDPTARRAEEAYQAATVDGWKERVMNVTGSYILHLDSAAGGGSDIHQGVGSDLDIMLGSSSEVKFLTGLTAELAFRQKKVTSAPSAPSNGRNQFVDWKTVYIGPKAGVSYMPVPWFELSAWGGLGALISIDGTLPVSQLADRQLYIGEAKTVAALGYRGAVCPRFVIGGHFLLGPCLGIQGNITPLPVARGPEQGIGNDGRSALVRQDGHFFDLPLMLSLGGQF